MNREVNEQIIAMNGSVNQSIIAMEELAELQQAISKSIRSMNGDPFVKYDTRQQLITEMADVLICLNQLKMIYDISDEEIDSMMELKERRTQERYGL